MAIVTSPRDTQVRVCYDPTFGIQSDIATPLSNGNFTAVFQATRRNMPDIVRTKDRIMDCSGRFPVDEQTLSRFARFQLEFDADPVSLGWVIAGVMGVAAAPSGSGPYTSAITMLGRTAFKLPYTSIVIQNLNASPSDPGQILVGCVVNKVVITAQNRDRIKVTAELISRMPQAASGFTAPACSPITPLRMENGLFTYDSVNSINPGSGDMHTITRRIVFTYDNKVLTDENAFYVGSEEAQLWETDNVRDIMFEWQVQGYWLDSLMSAALGSPGSSPEQSFHAVVCRFGPSGGGTTLTAPHSMLTIPDNSVTNEGQAAREYLNLVLSPTLGTDGVTLPLSASVVTPSGSAGYMQ